MSFTILKAVATAVAVTALAVGTPTISRATSNYEAESPAQHAVSALAYNSCNVWSTYLANSGSGYAYIPSASGWKLDDCVASSGLTGAGVGALQMSLNACYGKGLVVDWDFGPATRAALTQVQQAIGVTADGIFGPATRNAMRWDTHASGCQSVGWIQANYWLNYN